jgi:nucleotide-binding universal stress UspA family protein
MKAIIGIDNQFAYRSALQLLASLKFDKPEVTMVHAVDTRVPFVPLGLNPTFEIQADFAQASENLGRQALDTAHDDACARNIQTKRVLTYGGAVDTILRAAEDRDADLVAVGTEPRSMWNPSFLGSVSRSLVIGSKSSVLVAKGRIPEGRKLKVVMATDHSDYSNRWFEAFLKMRPKGIGEITVVTAYELDDQDQAILRRNVPTLDGMVTEWIDDRLADRNCEWVDRLTEAGYRAQCRVMRMNANDAIRRAMQDSQADLLVMGAQGHGFLDRLLIGSVSLHQAMYEPYPVLIVRA